MQKRITALLAISALVTFGLAAATPARASTGSASVSSAAAKAAGSPDGEQHARDVLGLKPRDVGLTPAALSEQHELVGYGALCLISTDWCLTYSAEGKQATITAGTADATGFDVYYIRQISGDNTFTLGSGYNGLYAGDDVYCFEDSHGDFLTASLTASGVIVNGYSGSCTGVYDEWVEDGDWLINVGETDWYYTQGDSEYPYSSVMTTGCDNDTTCRVWLEESAPSGNNDNQW